MPAQATRRRDLSRRAPRALRRSGRRRFGVLRDHVTQCSVRLATPTRPVMDDRQRVDPPEFVSGLMRFGQGCLVPTLCPQIQREVRTVALLAAGMPFAQDAKAPASKPNATAMQSGSSMIMGGQMGQMDEHMQKMKALHEKMTSATTRGTPEGDGRATAGDAGRHEHDESNDARRRDDGERGRRDDGAEGQACRCQCADSDDAESAWI